MSKSTATKTERFTKLISTKPTSARAAAKRLNTSLQTVYDMVYRLRSQHGVNVKRANGAYYI